MTSIHIKTGSLDETVGLGKKLGEKLRGGEVIELISDLGGGKTQLVRGMAEGMGSTDQVQSPSFTISRVYKSNTLELHHFDFHRLDDPGIVKNELAEVIGQPNAVVAIEWADSVADILPDDRLTVTIKPTGDTNREFEIVSHGPKHNHLTKDSR